MWWLLIPAVGIVGAWLYGAKLVATNAPPLVPPTQGVFNPGDFVMIDTTDRLVDPAVRAGMLAGGNNPLLLQVRGQVANDPNQFGSLNLVAVNIADPRLPPIMPGVVRGPFGVPLSSLSRTN